MSRDESRRRGESPLDSTDVGTGDSRGCLNCGDPRTADPYCPACGQATTVRRITFGETVGDFLNGLFTLESVFPKTVVALFRYPGRLFRDYLAGRRQGFSKPVPLFILCTALYLILAATIDYDPLAGTNIALTVQDEQVLQALTPRAARFMVEHINHILLVLAFSIGITGKVLFWRRHNLAEFIAIGFFVTSAYCVLGSVTMLAANYVDSRLRMLSFLALIMYITIVFPSFLDDLRLWVRVRSFLVAITALILYVVSGFGVSLLLVALTS